MEYKDIEKEYLNNLFNYIESNLSYLNSAPKEIAAELLTKHMVILAANYGNDKLAKALEYRGKIGYKTEDIKTNIELIEKLKRLLLIEISKYPFINP